MACSLKISKKLRWSAGDSLTRCGAWRTDVMGTGLSEMAKPGVAVAGMALFADGGAGPEEMRCFVEGVD